VRRAVLAGILMYNAQPVKRATSAGCHPGPWCQNWHRSRYHPAYRFTAPPTPVATLERAREIGQQAGLRYVYLGNVPGHPGEHTFCPNCGTILARRELFRLLHCDVTPDGQCPRCGQEIAGVGWAWKRRRPRLAPGKGVCSKQLT
jgi:pyruvate formate lyase activating enzyme